MSYTRTLADYAARLRYEDLPGEVIEQVKLLTLHTLGVALAACPSQQGKDAIALAKDLGGGKKEATIVGEGTKVSCTWAAFANATLSDILDWEDCSWTGHPSAIAIPAALAVGERIKTSGKDYITSVVAGYEVYQRIAMACQSSEKWDWLKRGAGVSEFHIWAAVVAAAKLLKFSGDKMEQALGIAGDSAPVMCAKRHTTMSDMYHYGAGRNCKLGIEAAFIAKKGITNLYGILDGEDDGYWVSVSDQCDWDWFTKELGKDYLIMETLFKHWPSNMWVQQPLDAVDAIMKEEKITASDVAEIIVNPIFQFRMAYKPDGYSSIMDAEFSIPFCIAQLLLDPEPSFKWYTDEKLKDHKILTLASRVRGEGPTVGLRNAFMLFRAGKYPEVSVRVVTKDGRHLSKTVLFPRGHPKNRFTYEEFRERFTQAASFALKPDKAKKAIEKILNLEAVDNLSEIGQLMYD